MSNDLVLSVLLKARDQASGQVGILGGALKQLATPTGLAAAAIIGVGVGLGIAVDKAQKFQTQLTTLQTGAGESAKNIKAVGQGILDMSVKTATSTDQLTSGMFMIESAGYHGAQGLQVLQAAAQGAKVGNADLGVTADATTTILKDYGMSSNQATQAVNGLIATVANGKTHMQDLAGSLSQILPTAAAAHVGLNDVEAALATMTGEGVPAANAATYLRQTIIGLEAPGSKAAKTLKSVGLTTQEVADEMHKSLPGALKMITDAVGKKFPEGSAKYVAALKDISGGSKTMQGMLDLTGNHLKDFQANVKNVSDAVKKGGNDVNGFADVQKTFAFQMDAAKAAVNKAFIEIGTKLLPVLTQLLSTVPSIIDKISAFAGKIGDLVNWFQNVQGPGEIVRDLIIGLGVAIAAIKIGSFLMTLPGLIAGFFSWAGAAGAAAVATIAATWPILAIGAVIAIVVAGIILAVKHWGQITAWLKGVWGAFTSWFGSSMSALGTFFHNIWNDISGFFVGVWNKIVAFAKQFGIYLVAAILGPAGIILALIITHWSQIKSFLQNTWNKIVNLAKSWATNLVVAAINLKNQMLQHIQDLIHKIEEFFTSLPGKAVQWGANLIQGFINGIKNMAGAVGSAISGIAGNIAKFLAFHSPAKQGPGATADQWAPNFMKMFIQGLKAHQPALQATVESMASDLGLMVSGHHRTGHPSAHHATHHTGHHTTHHAAHHPRSTQAIDVSNAVSNSLSADSGSGMGNSGVTIINNITINAGSADANQLYNLLIKRFTFENKRRGKLVTTTSGGRI